MGCPDVDGRSASRSSAGRSRVQIRRDGLVNAISVPCVKGRDPWYIPHAIVSTRPWCALCFNHGSRNRSDTSLSGHPYADRLNGQAWCERLTGPLSVRPGPARSRFETTEWTLVGAAAHSGEAAGGYAVAHLCERYWSPLYAFLCRQGYDAEDARDLTQAFFLHLLEHHSIRAVRRERGRFRTYLLGALKHFLCNHVRDSSRAKRGRGQRPVSLAISVHSGEILHDFVEARTPETVYERRWALTALKLALERVRREWNAAGKRAEFDRLIPWLVGTPPGGYAELALAAGVTEGASRMTVVRLRRQFRQALLEEVGGTVLDRHGLVEELGHLRQVLRSG
jgi:DNA-directed RNA polymerase specialized sigma24 family protein